MTYRPPRSKYSLRCSLSGVGGGCPVLLGDGGSCPSRDTPVLFCLGVPQSCPTREGSTLVLPWLGSTPVLFLLGISQSWLGGGTPVLFCWGYPPARDWGTPLPGTGVSPPPQEGPRTSHWSTPWKGHGTSVSIMRWRRGNPPWAWKDTCENSTFANFRMQAVKMYRN